MSSTGTLPGSSPMGTQHFDPTHQYQTGKSSQQRPIYPLNTGLPPYGEQFAFSLYPPYSRGKPYGNFPQYSSQPGIRVCQWQLVMPTKLRLGYDPSLLQPQVSSQEVHVSQVVIHNHLFLELSNKLRLIYLYLD